MLSNEDIEKKDELEKIIRNSNNLIELLDILRGKCEKLEINNNMIEMEVDGIIYFANIKENKITKIRYYEQSLLQYKEVNF